eukprot:scaffold4394_cov113-Isochrysis_galbana.AAC.18
MPKRESGRSGTGIMKAAASAVVTAACATERPSLSTAVKPRMYGLSSRGACRKAMARCRTKSMESPAETVNIIASAGPRAQPMHTIADRDRSRMSPTCTATSAVTGTSRKAR